MEFFGQTRAHQLVSELPDDAWTRLSCGNGAYGPREYDWTAARSGLGGGKAGTTCYWLLARRSLTDPADIAYYICFCPAGTSLEELARIAGPRWMVEEFFQTAKSETGLNEPLSSCAEG